MAAIGPLTIADIDAGALSTAQSGIAVSWWRARMGTRKLVLIGDSTSDGTTGPSAEIYNRLAQYTTVGGALEGVTVLDFGSNGNTLANWLSGIGSAGKLLANLTSDAGAVVLRYGINDVRQGATSEDQLVALLLRAVDAIRAKCPVAIIALCVPNSFTLDDVGTAGYVVPNTSAQAYSTLLRSAYFRAWQARPYCILMDLQGEIFGTTCRAKATGTNVNALMGDQLHPSVVAQRIIADYHASVFDVRWDVTPYNPYNRGISNLFPVVSKWRQLGARIEAYNAPHLVYPGAVYDNRLWQHIVTGKVGTVGSNYVDIVAYDGLPSPGPLASMVSQPSDVVVFGTNLAFPYAPVSSTNNTFTGYSNGVGYLRCLAPGAMANPPTVGQSVVIARHRFARNTLVEAAYLDPLNTYKRQGYVAALPGSGQIVIAAYPDSDKTAANWTSVTTADTLHIRDLAGKVLTGATFGTSGNNLTITISGFTWATAVGYPVAIIGTHAMES